ncbi:MAG: fused response regulator/phosphatase [Nitrospinae bacterium]|nr:fused response regulator/phosphatase [Nitrospinota bacterium]
MKTAKILLVDDNPDNVYLLEVILQARNYKTVSARNGREAVDAVTNDGEIDIILMDVMMPEMDGFEASRHIRNRKESAHIPIIMMTAKKRELGDVVRGLDEGAVDYVTKPFDEEELLARVKSMLRIKSLYDENRHLLSKVLKQQSLMDQELKVAAKVQLAMLPALDGYKNQHFKVHPFYRATVDIGGDFYDLMDYGDHKTAFFIADVSGHGPSAAMIVAMLKALLIGERSSFPPPSEMLRRLNVKLTGMIPDEHFVTAFFGVIDSVKGTVTFSRAGHPSPFLLTQGGGEIADLTTDGVVLGMFEEAEFGQATVKFSGGDKMLMYSDGLFEVWKGEEIFGYSRFRDLVKNNGRQNGEELVKSVIGEIDGFWDGESLRDDMALIAVEFV